MTFKSKQELISFVKHQVNVELPNDDCILNKKRNVLYTSIKRVDLNNVLSLLHKYGIRYEPHTGDAYFIFVR